MIGLIVPSAFATLIIEGADGGECSDYGIWDKATKTCTLTKDVDDFVIIEDISDIDWGGDKKYHGVLDGMTLNGNGHTISIPPDTCADHPNDRGMYYDRVLFVRPPDVTIKNLTIIGQEVECQFSGLNAHENSLFVGILHDSSHGMLYVDNVKISGKLAKGILINNGVIENSSIHLETLPYPNDYGGGIDFGGNGMIKNNEISGLKNEIYGTTHPPGIDPWLGSITPAIHCGAGGSSLQEKLGNDKLIISDNYIHDNNLGLRIMDRCDRAVFINNVVQDNEIGVISAGNHYQNSFIDNDFQVGSWGHFADQTNLGKFFNEEYGGNYWSDYDSSNEGCTDKTHDNFCDTPYTIPTYGIKTETRDDVSINTDEPVKLSTTNSDDMPWNVNKIWETSINHGGDILQEAVSEKTPVSFSVTASRSGQSVSLNCSPSSGYEFPLGVTEVICQTNDQRKSSFQVTVQDNTPPTLTVPSDIELDALDAHGAPAEFDTVLASDAVGIKESSCTMHSGMLFPIGENIVECIAEDTSGNTSSETFKVTVVSDVPPPVISVPDNIVIQADSRKGTTVSFPKITATDELGILEQPTCNPATGSFFSVGITIVECKAKNMQEYVGTATFSIVVEPPQSITRELIPSRENIGTEWQFPSNRQVYDELSDSRGLSPDSFTGFAEYTWMGFMRSGDFNPNFLDLYVYRFDTKQNADSFYSEHVNYWYDRGGYSEWSPGWGAVNADECYGRTTTGTYVDKISLYCTKNNIVVFATTTGYESEMKSKLSDFADGVFDKASRISTIQSNSEPESEPNPICGDGTVFKNGQCILDEREGGGCLIATAAFGSELAPQVQFLRELRDNTVLQTTSGTTFMNGFNQFYYSFSPAVADYERENPVFKEAVKVTLTPLLTSLTLLNYVEIDSEEEMLGYGISIILLNIGMYFVAPAALIIALKKRFL